MLPSVFPPYPDRKDFEIYASMTPAREVGGDFYELFLVDESHLCMMIADVSGKGIPAALFMMSSKILLEHNVKMGKSPAQVLADVNTAICNKNLEDMFVTVWLGIIDLSTGKMTCSNAGHEYPMMKRPGERYELIKDKHDLVLGAMKDLEYHEYELLMEPGASLFLYTDGLSETIDPDEQMFGTERILEQLNKEPDASPEETLHSMKEAVVAYIKGKEPFDDMTMMSFVYYGAVE
jgi:sigma-B regulation protein RsbU (phosphoserine phosphatase)